MELAQVTLHGARCLPIPLSSNSSFSPYHLSSNFLSCSKFPISQPNRTLISPLFSNSSNSPEPSNYHDLALLFEVEGVLADVHKFGNRQAFNVAFKNLGLDCANWSEPVYTDLIRRSSGDEKTMLLLFFNRIGWPTSLPTSEKDSFVKSVLREKKKALEDLASSSSLPLRPGVENFIDDALNERIPIIMLTTYGRNGEKTAKSMIEKLGQERVSKIKIIGTKEVEESFYGQLSMGQGLTSSLDEQLIKQARKAASLEKQRVAKEVASILKLSVEINEDSPEKVEMIVASLRAGAESSGLDVKNCVLISGSQIGVNSAERIFMPCVVIRNSLTARAEFRSAKLVMDGFGGADLTINKLRNKMM